MSKPLSEQVAELEAERDQLEAQRSYLWDIKESLRVENKELRNDHREGECSKLRIELHDIYQRAYRAERERDDARAQGISDLNRIHRHQATIRRLEEENTALRAGQGTWPDDKPDDSPAGEQVPRVITTAELSHGMRVAGKREDGTWTAGTVNGNSSIISRSGLRMGSLADFERFILLADAPVRIDIPSEQVRFKGMTDLRYKEPAPAPRLAVHDLEVAPVGSWLMKPKGSIFAPMLKVHSGKWVTVGDELMNTRPEWSAEDVIEYGWANATLTVNESNEKGADQ